jgi:hypothetical protein
MRDKKTFKKSMIGLLVMSVMLFAMSITAFAADGASEASVAEGLKQTDSSTSSVKVQWNSSLSSEYYVVLISETKDGTYYFANGKTDFNYAVSNSSYKYIYNLDAGKTYYVKVASYTKSNSNYIYEGVTDAFQVVTTPEKVDGDTITQTKGTAKGIAFKWTKVSGATGYKVVKVGGGSKVVTTNSAVVSGAAGNRYEFKVYAYRKSASGYVAMASYGYSSYMYTSPARPMNVGSETAGNLVWQPTKSSQVTVRWDRNTSYYYPDGYQMEVYSIDGKKKLANVKTTSTYKQITSTSICTAIKNKGFIVRVRSYKKTGSTVVYSAWAKKVVVPQAAAKISAKSSTAAKITWSKVANVDHYVIFVSRDSGYSDSGNWAKKTLSAKTTSYTITGLKKYKDFAVYVLPVVKVNGKTYYSHKTWYTYGYIY